MVRSGKLLVIVLSAAALAGCTTAPPPTAPTPTATATTCPDGLAAALEAYLSPIPLGDRVPDDVVVTEFPEDLRFSSDLVASMSGCILAIDSFFANGDRQSQLFGIAAHLDEAAVIATVRAAGWEQPAPDTVPYAWQLPSDPMESVSIFPGGNPDQPVLGFPSWAEYLAPEDVLLGGGIAF